MLSQKELAFVNTKYVSKNFKQQSLAKRLNKGELAYFLSNLTNQLPVATKKINNINNLKYKNEIQRVVDRSIISLDKKGNFRQNDTINSIIYIATVAKALNLKPSNTVYPELQAYKKKWFYNFLVIGFDQKILTKSSLSKLSNPLTHATFAQLSTRISTLTNDINAQLTFNKSTAKKVQKQVARVQQVNINITSVTAISDTLKRVNIKLDTNRPLRHGKSYTFIIG